MLPKLVVWALHRYIDHLEWASAELGALENLCRAHLMSRDVKSRTRYWRS